jgi:cell division septum initiation protein DivIVA
MGPDDSLHAHDIEAAGFSCWGDGYAKDEVHAFLRRVAARVAELEATSALAMDDDGLAALVGEETVRVLKTAREGATSIRARAEEAATEQLRSAEQARQEAEELAERVRREADAAAAEVLETAFADARTQVGKARAEATVVLEEAARVQAAVLAEATARRDAAQAQLAAARDRIAGVVQRARQALDEALAAALAAADQAGAAFQVEISAPTPLEVTFDEQRIDALLAARPEPVVTPEHMTLTEPVELAARTEPVDLAALTEPVDVTELEEPDEVAPAADPAGLLAEPIDLPWPAGHDLTSSPSPEGWEERAARLEPAVQALARGFKRVLAHEQNGVLDKIRRMTGTLTVDDLAGPEGDHGLRYREAAREALRMAVALGARSLRPDLGDEATLTLRGPVTAALDTVSAQVVEPLRQHLAAALDAAHGDPLETASMVRGVYRDWRTDHLDARAADLVYAAESAGAFAMVEPGIRAGWVSDPTAGS